jgi:hypothetical protein
VAYSFSPAQPHLQLELLDEDKLLLKEVVPRQASSSSAAELAAAGALGSSPGSSFSQEFARFLSTSMSPVRLGGGRASCWLLWRMQQDGWQRACVDRHHVGWF